MKKNLRVKKPTQEPETTPVSISEIHKMKTQRQEKRERIYFNNPDLLVSKISTLKIKYLKILPLNVQKVEELKDEHTIS